MGIGDQLNHRQTANRHDRILNLLVLYLFISLSAIGQLDEPRKISREGTINRDPVISDTGLAAWMFYYSTNDQPTANSHIAVYVDKTRSEITENATAFYGAAKPTVASNHVLFIGGARSAEGDISWVLREVPTRDDGDIKELEANYRWEQKEGEREEWFDLQSTNEVDRPAADSSDTTTEVRTNAARRLPSGESEVWSWRAGDTAIQRVTHDSRNDFAPSHWGDIISWQKAKGWPFGWEIMALVGDTRMQLTTNYYYDMGPKVHGNSIVWYGWDGFDYEVYLFDASTTSIVQITSNRFDDVAPTLWNDVLVWEGYSAVEADIFMWRKGEITKLSNNLDDDLYPRIWNNKVVWQGFDGDDYEIYIYDIEKGDKPVKLTTNNYDDTNPEIHDDLVVWMGYHENWDAEIFYLDVKNLAAGAELRPVQLTTNEEDDRDPKTASRRIVWVEEREGETSIMLAEPK